MSPSTSDILPSPFSWIEIPPGRVQLDYHGWFDVAAFQIAKYPVTVAQYAVFIELGGYDNLAYWLPAGWQHRQSKTITLPHGWTKHQTHKPDHPVVGISWFEAYAFTQWLTEFTGENIHLPTEQQWQRAAQGDDGRAFPWGDRWEESRCNNSVGLPRAKAIKKGNTTPVTRYGVQGDSPFGVVDMSGNAMEWTLCAYMTAQPDLQRTDHRVTRGGSWEFSDEVFYRVDLRNGFNPHLRGGHFGLRLARS